MNKEIQKSSPLARYLTAYYLLRDESLRGDFAGRDRGLVTRMAGALGVPARKSRGRDREGERETAEAAVARAVRRQCRVR